MKNENQTISIRCTRPDDLDEILAVHQNAFGAEEGPEIVELVTNLLVDETAAPYLSLLAEIDGRIAGHILFTAVRLPSAHRSVSVHILAPLAVSPAYQGRGVGAAMVYQGLKQLEASGCELVFVLGHPGYYPKFGFRPAGVLGYEAPYPIPPEHQDAWMVLELQAGAIGIGKGKIQCAFALDQPRYWQE